MYVVDRVVTCVEKAQQFNADDKAILGIGDGLNNVKGNAMSMMLPHSVLETYPTVRRCN
jgi:hypothetical protein